MSNIFTAQPPINKPTRHEIVLELRNYLRSLSATEDDTLDDLKGKYNSLLIMVTDLIIAEVPYD